METPHKQCSSCQAELPADAAFCPVCGHPSAAPDDTTLEPSRSCVACDKTIPAESVYCMYCGQKQTPVHDEINTNVPVYISHVDLWPSGPREVKDGGIFAPTMIGRWIHFRFVLRDAHDRPTASNGEVVIAVIKDGQGVDHDLPAERLLEEFEKRAYFTHHYKVAADDFAIVDGVLSAGYKNTSEMVYCQRATGSNHITFHCLFTSNGRDWLVWRPSYPRGAYGNFPRAIHWD